MDTLQLLSASCIVFTIWMFATSLSDLRRMVSGKSTANIQFLLFLTTATKNLGWLCYGQLKGDWTLITVNTIGVTLHISYMLAFLYFTTEKLPSVAKVAFAEGTLGTLCLYFGMVVPDPQRRLNQLGLLYSGFTISMYLSPLAELAKVIRTRSTKCLSFWLTVATILTSASWTLYGLQLSDYYIVVPNIPGIVSSLIRFWLFWSFPPASQDKHSYWLLQA